MRLGSGSWLHGFSFRCLRTTIASDGARVTHPPLYVEADRRGVSLRTPGRALRATPDTLWLADSRYGTWLRCPRTASSSDGTNCYDKIMYECFRGIDRCCPALFTPFAYGQPATVSVRFDTAGRNRFTIFTQMLEVCAHPRPGALLTRLEEAGINLYCVNPYGGCTEAFRRVAV